MDTNLHLPAEFQLPDYGGSTIANLPATIARLLGVDFHGLPGLYSPLWPVKIPGIKRVVLLIVDGMGANLLTKEKENLPGFVADAAIRSQITSVFPSTTVAALSSLWSGLAPAQHGLVGLNLLFPHQGTIGQLLAFTPSFGRFPDSLIEAGLDPNNFLHGQGFGEQLARAGLPTYQYNYHNIVDSPLSHMLGRGARERRGFYTMADMMSQMRHLLESQAGESMYVAGYWPMVDTLSHRFTWKGESVGAETRSVMATIENEFIRKLSKKARRDTILILVADHGQVEAPQEQQIFLEDHPELERMLLLAPAGEPRVPYLYAKQGYQDSIIEYVNSELGYAFYALPSRKALEDNLLGPQPHSPETELRVGDVMLISKKGYSLFTANSHKHTGFMIGRHGSMTTAEMNVELTGIPL